jgi:hypothetical protein
MDKKNQIKKEKRSVKAKLFKRKLIPAVRKIARIHNNDRLETPSATLESHTLLDGACLALAEAAADSEGFVVVRMSVFACECLYH